MGRLRSIGFGVVIMIIGAIMQATSYGRVQMILARVVTGIGMGAINSTTPVLQVGSPAFARPTVHGGITNLP